MYDRCDPLQILFQDTIFATKKEGDSDVFTIALPFFDLKDMELTQKGEELILSIKNERRRFILPGKLKNKEVKSAKYESGVLKLVF